MNKQLFLDANAHVPMNESTLRSLITLNYSLGGHGHPLSPSKPGVAAAKIIEMSREKIAKFIGAKSSNQIIFTNGCSQACEWVVDMLCHIDINNILLMSPMEHPAVNFALENVSMSGYMEDSIDHFPIKSNGILDINKINNSPLIIGKGVCIHMNNEVGTIQPLRLLNCNILFSDMSQSLGKIPINVTRLGVDFAVFGSHKYGGPSGVGFIYIKNTDHWIEYGNGSRYGMDIPGTLNVAGIGCAATALEYALENLEERNKNMVEFTNILESGLKDLGFKIICEDGLRCPNTSFVMVPDKITSQDLLLKLGDKDIYCGMGSACGSLYGDKSELMKHLGNDSDISKYMRISQWGDYKKEDAEYFLHITEAILKDGTKKKENT